MTPEQEELVLTNLGLARKLAWKYRWTGRDHDDLVQQGTLGLIKAALGYDPALGSAFSSYAWRCIENTLLGKPDALGEFISLDAPLPDENEGTFAELLPDTHPSPEERAVTGHVHRLLEELPERDAEIIRLRYGLADGIERTCEEVGAVVGLTKVRVSQLERRALARLRKIVSASESRPRETPHLTHQRLRP